MMTSGLTIVIPTKNRHDDLMVALHSIAVQTRMPEEIVLVDQSAIEIDAARHATVCEWFSGRTQIRWIHDRSIQGLVAAKREGVRHASFGIVCFLEDDIVLDVAFVEEIARAMEADLGLVGCSGVVTDVPFGPIFALLHAVFHRGLFSDPRPRIYANWRSLGDAPIPAVTLSGGLSAWRREVFLRIPFDTVNGFHMLEDVDFSTRVALAGQGRMAIVPTARLEHHFAPAGRASMGLREAKKACEFVLFLRTRPHRSSDVLWLAWVLMGVALQALAKSLRNLCARPIAGVMRGIWEGATRPISRLS